MYVLSQGRATNVARGSGEQHASTRADFNTPSGKEALEPSSQPETRDLSLALVRSLCFDYFTSKRWPSASGTWFHVEPGTPTTEELFL